MTAAPQIHGKVAVVTGAANGIGRAIALRLAGDGADIALLDIDPQGLRSLADEVEGLGRTALAIETDMLDRAAIKSAFNAVGEVLGPVDVLVNNVGQSARDKAAPFWEASAGLADFLVRICLHTTMDACREAVPSMRERKSGRIVNIASDSAYIGSKSAAAYAAAKAGVIGRASCRERV